MARAKLGEILVKAGLLTSVQLDAVIKHQRQWGVSLGRAAVAKGFCTDAQVLASLGQQLDLPVIDLDKEELSAAFAATIPQKVAEQHHVVPLRVTGARSETLVVAMAAPATPASQDAVLAVAKKSRLQVFLATDEAVHRGIGRLYRGDQLTFDPNEFIVDARSQMLDLNLDEGAPRPAPAAPRPAAPIPLTAVAAAEPVDPFSGLKLSPNARLVVEHAAKTQSLAPRAVLEKVVEGWAANQLKAWAQARAAAAKSEPGKP